MADSRWLLLIHQIPPKPNYFRVKIWRRLQRLGAVGIKNSVYALPRSDRAQEDFQWVVREIVAGGGDASVCEASFVEGLSDEHVEAMFHAARDAEYAALVEEARRIGAELPARRLLPTEQRGPLATDLVRLRRRLAEIVALDVLGAPGREAADEVGLTPESAGLRAISSGFPLVTGSDEETAAKAAFIYDALYAALKQRLEGANR